MRFIIVLEIAAVIQLSFPDLHIAIFLPDGNELAPLRRVQLRIVYPVETEELTAGLTRKRRVQNDPGMSQNA